MTDQHSSRLRAVLDRAAGNYKQLNGARDLGDYLNRERRREDEEVLTEPLLADLMETLLGFPRDAYFPQLGRSGLKPDFTPHDLVAHRFVLDAKSSTQDLAHHEPQIRAYIDQRQLDFGVLFNLREIRVYRRGEQGHVLDLLVPILPLWEASHGQAIMDEAAGAALDAFVELFRHRSMGLDERVTKVRQARAWSQRQGAGSDIEIDIEFLVDRLHDLSRTLQDDAAAQYDALKRHLTLTSGREGALVGELQLLALDLAPGTSLEDLPDSAEGFRNDEGLGGRAWRQYLLRVSQLALTRIMLYRSWEDVEFVESYLYDGGFDRWYEQLNRNLQEVLSRAFADGRARYGWLYGADNNYDWYRPRDEALVDVLYALVPVPLGKLDADVLGGLYELYVDDIDRDRLGQFFTPRSVVRFMLDRAGYKGADGVFRLEGDRRTPVKVLDFATGSGGFLVEAARRVIDEAGLDGRNERDLTDGLAVILRGFHGCEISPFPYYLTEVNLLLQVSRLLGGLRALGANPVLPALGVVHADTLATRRAHDESIEGMEAGSRADRGGLERDDRFGLVPLDHEKREAFDRMRQDETFDLVVGNPPYVFESNNKVLFDRLRALPAWRDLYRGKSDYLYYFLVLAAEKVKPGGRLCVITPAGWMNAGNASWLRERLAGTLRLDELFLFGSYRLFAPEHASQGKRRHAPTPTVESAILVATKGEGEAGHELKIVALEDESAAAAEIAAGAGGRVPDRDALLTHMGERMEGRAGRRRGVNVHRLRQRDLDHELPWPIKHSARDVASKVVAHLDGAAVEPLSDRWDVVRGIETGADGYSTRIRRRLSAKAARGLAESGAVAGDPILELPPGREREQPWTDRPDLLAKSVEPHGILYGALDEANYTSLVWIGREDNVPEPVIASLEQWRPVLSTRAELVRNPKRRWFETAWPRDKGQMNGPKVIALYRTDRGRFAVDEAGRWQPSNKATICTPTQEGLSVAYLGGLLNSELLDLWYRVRGKIPRDIWRNYEPKPMSRMPYRHVERTASPDDSPRLARLGEAITARDAARAQAIVGELIADGGEAEWAGAVEQLVRAIADNRRALLPLRTLFPELARTVKDPWRARTPPLDERQAIAETPANLAVSIRIDPALELQIETDGRLGRATLSRNGLVFTHSRRTTATVTGPDDRLALLERLVEGRRLVPSELEAVLLPRDLEAFAAWREARVAEVTELLDEGRVLVEAVERLVCRLYDLPAELEEAVVRHAAERAVAGLPADE